MRPRATTTCLPSLDTHLWAYEQDFTIEAEYTAVVSYAAVHHGHPDVADDAVRVPVAQQACQTFNAVGVRVHLQKMVFTAIARDLQLWPDTIPAGAEVIP